MSEGAVGCPASICFSCILPLFRRGKRPDWSVRLYSSPVCWTGTAFRGVQILDCVEFICFKASEGFIFRENIFVFRLNAQVDFGIFSFMRCHFYTQTAVTSGATVIYKRKFSDVNLTVAVFVVSVVNETGFYAQSFLCFGFRVYCDLSRYLIVGGGIVPRSSVPLLASLSARFCASRFDF